ncbi:MAG: hypothetical protein M3Z08_12425, partial [Chloroflexota bacterium]|nr:hypothetical protein [Chloroflexota bacterium]
DELLSYPVDYMRTTAAKILVRAQQALDEHDKAWNAALNYCETTPSDFGAHVVRAVLQPHAQRLRQSYEWQLALAQSLFDAIDSVEGTDVSIRDLFMGYHGFAP